MNNNHNQCAACGEHFTQANLAWIMSMCGHNICNQCLKSCILNKAKSIACKQCKKKYSVNQEILQQFPKNITIVKNLRDSKNNSTITAEPKKNDSSLQGSLLLSNSSVKQELSYERLMSLTCSKHGKPLQIICTVDRGLLCAHCAIFGQHQNHTFKTIDEFTSEYSNFKQSCSQLLLQKHICEENLRGKKYRSAIISKISDRKDKMVVEIRQNFARLATYIKDAESKIYQQLIKCFRTADAEISKIVKQESEIDRNFQRWKKQIEDYVREVESMTDLKSKIHIYYKQDKPSLGYGQRCLKELQNNLFTIKETIEQKINSIKIQYQQGLDGHIFNFAKIVVSQFQIKPQSKIEFEAFREEQPKYLKKEMKIQFVKSNELQIQSSKSIKQVLTLPIKKQDPLKSSRSNLNKVKSNPKLPKGVLQKIDAPKKNFTPPKPLQRNSEQPKHTQNLQFAQRMLHQFLSSTDTLDITGCQLTDQQIYHIVEVAAQEKPIKCLKICKNKLTNNGLLHLVPFLSHVTSINLSYNGLTDECVDIFVDKRESMLGLRIINLGHNKVNQRKVKSKIEQLKKYGVITTL